MEDLTQQTVLASRDDVEIVLRVDRATAEYAELNGNPLERARESVALDPQCPLGHCLVGLFSVISGCLPLEHEDITGSYQKARALVEDIAKSHPDLPREREEAFVEALLWWSRGQWRAGNAYLEGWLAKAPIDMLALQLAYDGYMIVGESKGLRDITTRVWQWWPPNSFYFSFLEGRRAMGEEECGNMRDAEAFALRAMNQNKRDVWAMHALMHVLDSEGRANEGYSMMASDLDHWEQASLYRQHMAWHHALFAIDLGRFSSAWRLFDNYMRHGPDSGMRCTPFLLTDASSLLWRLMLNGEVDEGMERWQGLAQSWEKFDALHLSCFHDLHTMMVYAALSTSEELEEDERELWRLKAEGLLEGMRQYVSRHTSLVGSRPPDSPSVAREARGFTTGHPARAKYWHQVPDNVWTAESVGIAACEGILAYAREDFEGAIDHLMPLRYHTADIGGSHAQRDVINQTLMEAAFRLEDTTIARVLSGEKVTNNSNSGQAWLRHSTVLDRCGLHQEAAEARHTAFQLGTGQGHGSSPV